MSQRLARRVTDRSRGAAECGARGAVASGGGASEDAEGDGAGAAGGQAAEEVVQALPGPGPLRKRPLFREKMR